MKKLHGCWATKHRKVSVDQILINSMCHWIRWSTALGSHLWVECEDSPAPKELLTLTSLKLRLSDCGKTKTAPPNRASRMQDVINGRCW